MFYLESDDILFDDRFEKFMATLNLYAIKSLHIYTLPGYIWAYGVKTAGIRFQNFS